MADFDFDRLNAFAAILARRKYEARWPAIGRAFKRDVTSYEWGLGKILDTLGCATRTFPSKLRIPGRVAIAETGKDGPDPEVYADFLARGGTLIVEGTSRLDDLGITATQQPLPSGCVVVEGLAIAELASRTFWCDAQSVAIGVADASVLVHTGDGPMVSRIEHGGGVVVIFSVGIAGYRRDSKSEDLLTPRALAQQLVIPIADSSDMLADDTRFPSDLFTAQLTMFSVLGGVVANAL